MKNLTVKNLGPIQDAAISFGDLTLFVGPQASGKSILLQLIKLIADKDHICKTLEQYGYTWNENIADLLDRFLGEGMSGIWNAQTSITVDEEACSSTHLTKRHSEVNTNETIFYAPAQRVICLQNGWPRFFTDYDDSVPYVLRQFSETLRLQLESDLYKKGGNIFPESNNLKAPLIKSFSENIFPNSQIVIDKSAKKRLKLEIGDASISFFTWSAGQKEFMPLLLSFYWLCPAIASDRKDALKYVIIEEPEMGLHPQAIKSVLLQVIDLMSRGYKIIISTHSPVLLEFAWALEHLQKNNAHAGALAELLGLQALTPSDETMLNAIIQQQQIKTYYFDLQKNGKVHVKDISSLDADHEDRAIAEWGGLSSFSARATDIILKVTNNEH
jgi:predicted ATP-binding protein involved in virulence